MQRTRIVVLAAVLLFLPALLAAELQVKIENPGEGFVTERLIEIRGTVTGSTNDWAVMVYNGVSRRIGVQNGRFSTKMVLSRGDNLIEVIASDGKDTARDRVSFYANVPKCDVKIVLTWETDKTDMDLWVTDPSGEKVFYAHKTSKIGGQLDIDVTTGYGPETFTLKDAVAGDYQIQIQNFTPGKSPVTRMRVDLILFEGTDRELRRSYSVVAFRESEVISVVSFAITPGMEFLIR